MPYVADLHWDAQFYPASHRPNASTTVRRRRSAKLLGERRTISIRNLRNETGEERAVEGKK